MKTTLSKSALWLAFAALAGSRCWAQDSSSAPAPESPPDLSAVTARVPDRGLRFNFRGAPLETVLNYMSEAAGFVIVLQTPVTGTVDMWSTQPVSPAEAVSLLEIALNKNGYAISVQGRTLVISSKDDAKKQNIPIHTGNDPAQIPQTAEMVMQIIPLRHIDAVQAAKDLATLIPGSATMTANQDSNSLVVTDTEMNVHHIVELVSALDTSIETTSTTQVFPLKNADPVEMASLISNLYGSPTGTTNTNAGGNNQGRGGLAALFGGGLRGGGGGGGFGGGGFGGGGGQRGGGGGGGGNARTASTGTGRTIPVVAIADPRTYSVVVTASKDQLPDIAEMIARLDSNTGRQQKAYTIPMQYADVQQVQTILQNLFQSSTQRTSTSTQADPLSTRETTNAAANNNTTSQVNMLGGSTSQ
jgi:type II secretory pathway component GspD/PulD (secretin)